MKDQNKQPEAQATEQEKVSATPEKVSKSKLASHIIKIFFVLITIELFCFPLLMMAIDGTDETAMDSEVTYSYTSFSLKGYIDGTYQTAFENWFSTHYPLRSDVVTTYKTMTNRFDSIILQKSNDTETEVELDTKDYEISTNASGQTVITIPTISTETALETGRSESGTETLVEEETTLLDYYLNAAINKYASINNWQLSQEKVEPTGTIYTDTDVIGKSGYIFEPTYIDEYLGYTSPYTDYDPDQLQLTVDNLTYIQNELNKRGIGFVFVISSSKASQYADYIPDWYKALHTSKEGYVRAYDALIPMLENSTLNYVDSKQLFEEVGLVVTFPKTGIHWNKLAAFEAARRAVTKLEAQTDTTARHMTFDTITASTSPSGFGNSEMDVYNITNAAHSGYATIVDKYYFWPDVYVEDESVSTKNFLIQGGSFTHDLVSYYGKYVGKVRQIYYNWNSFLDQIGGCSSNDNPLVDSENWEKLLNNVDYVVFEATEQQLATIAWNSTGHSAIYRSLYEYLYNHSGD